MTEKKYFWDLDIALTKDGLIREIRYNRPITLGGKEWEHVVYSWCNEKQAYKKETSKALKGFEILDDWSSSYERKECIISMDEAFNELRNIIMHHCDQLHVDVRIAGKSVNYKTFCESLNKSEVLFRAKKIISDNTEYADADFVAPRGYRRHKSNHGSRISLE